MNQDGIAKLATEIESLDIKHSVNYLLLLLGGPRQLKEEPEKIGERMESMQKLASIGAQVVLCKSTIVPLLRNCETFSDDTQLEDDAIISTR